METEFIETVENVETVEETEVDISCVDVENLEQLETSIETDVSQTVEISQQLESINQGLQLVCGLLLFFFIWSIFNWLYRFFNSFF